MGTDLSAGLGLVDLGLQGQLVLIGQLPLLLQGGVQTTQLTLQRRQLGEECRAHTHAHTQNTQKDRDRNKIFVMEDT